MPRPDAYAPISLDNQTALVTGATSGIGEAVAWRLADAGANLVILGRRKDRLEKLADDIRSSTAAKVHTVVLDVQDTQAVTSLPAALPAEFRDVDILVNNAGLALGTASADANDLAQCQQMLQTNVMAVIAFTKTFVAGMRERGRGHLINIGSIAGHEAYVGGSVYCATKHAIDAFTTSARHDLVGTPVRVTAISPGAVNTEFSTVRLGDKEKADAVYENLVPLLAADIADNVVYAATRPRHVQIADIVVLATNQSAAKSLARVGPSLGGSGPS